ncbi:MAG: hypothetical protein JNK40_11990 [Chromatiales bacterium]|nr:hypothetical protein [Chromatiales bacterium]
MMVTEWFVFLHLHKSGGSFVNEGLRRHVPGAREVGYHLPASLIPAAARQLPVIGLVRNPWSYYVSWFSFQQQKPRPNALFRVLSDDGRLGFRDTIHRMLDLGRDDALLARLVDLLPRDYGSRGLNLPGFALAPIRGTGLGFYSYLYQYLYAGSGSPAHIGRMEELPQALLMLFDAIGYTASAGLGEYLRSAPRVNSSRHDAYGSYYDAELRDRVASRDALVIGRHGYAFEA